MMKRNIILSLLMVCLLCGCAKTDSTSEQWYMAVDRLKQQENYTVEEITVTPEQTICRLRQYDLTKARTEDGEGTLYFSLENGTCYGLGWVEDPGVWGKKRIETSNLYFFDYTLLDRLNRLSGYIDMGLLEYREKENAFVAKDLNSRYVYRDLEHTPVSLEIIMEDGMITGIHEVWHCTKEGEDLGIYEDTVTVTDVSATVVRLPADVIESEEET